MEEPRLRPAGFFHAPATPARTAHPRATCGWAASVLSRWKPLRVGMAPLTPTPRRAHRGEVLVETFDTASLVHAGNVRERTQRGLLGQAKGRPVASKNIYDS